MLPEFSHGIYMITHKPGLYASKALLWYLYDQPQE